MPFSTIYCACMANYALSQVSHQASVAPCCASLPTPPVSTLVSEQMIFCNLGSKTNNLKSQRQRVSYQSVSAAAMPFAAGAMTVIASTGALAGAAARAPGVGSSQVIS